MSNKLPPELRAYGHQLECPCCGQTIPPLRIGVGDDPQGSPDDMGQRQRDRRAARRRDADAQAARCDALAVAADIAIRELYRDGQIAHHTRQLLAAAVAAYDSGRDQ